MNIDDPKLTAYALGELTGEERQTVETEISKDPQLRAFVEETQAFSRLLSHEFHAEKPPVELAPAQRLEVVDQADGGEKIVRFRLRRVAWAAGITSIAAALAIIPFLTFPKASKVPPADFTGGSDGSELGIDGDASISRVNTAAPIPTPPPVTMAFRQPVIAIAPPPAPTLQAPTVASNEPQNTLAVSKPLALKQLSNIKRFSGTWSKNGARSAGGGVVAAPTKALADASWASSPNTESYSTFSENPFRDVAQEPLSTFSIDVDTASYSNVRRFLKSGQRPPVGAVRIEELINYFHYDYPQPKGDAPFSVNVETARCPWEPQHRLVRIGLKGREIEEAKRPASNLIFLIDVSGSMEDENKLPLLKASMRQLVEQLGENDKVAMVVYSGSTGVALPSTRGNQKDVILRALDGLKADGSTNGAGGIQLAYKTAVENLIPKGTNRVILATDGDFNVGTTSESELTQLIEEKRKSGVFLTVLGFGEGNLKDSMMKKLASHGNGNYAYIDSLREGRKVLVKQLGSTLVTIAKDVKIQVEFNPKLVGSYRLVGYESRMLAKEDFNNDKKDAGEIGAGHTVTALYEVVPAGLIGPYSVDPLKYQPEKSATPPPPPVEGPASKELLTVKLRYKNPTEDTSRLIEQPVNDNNATIEQSSPDFRFAAAVAEFGMLLRGSSQSGSANWNHVYKLAASAEGHDEGGYRAEFLELVEKAH